MRLVQVTVPAGRRETVLDALEDEGVDYVVSDETSGREYTAVVSFPLPDEGVEPILGTLREAGLDDDAFTVVLNAETVVSRHFSDLEERFKAEESEDRIARQELETKAYDLAPDNETFFVLTAISAVVAAAGILLDSPAVVVGSMVIAPLIGPAMATSVGTVVDDATLFRRGVKLQVLGGLLAVASALGFALVVRHANLVAPGIDVLTIEQVRGRMTPDFLSLAVALGAGVAGALSLSTGVSAAIVGVMIAAALVPPTAIVGIGVAWGRPTMAIAAGVLVLVNVISINLSALVTLWYGGYRPDHWFRRDRARSATLKRVGLLAAGVALLSVFLAGVTVAGVQSAQFEDGASAAIDRTLEAPPYASLERLETSYEYRGVVFRWPDRVVVTVGRTADGDYRGLATALEEAIARETGRDVAVQVRYVEVSAAG